MIARGGIFAELRSQMLDAFPMTISSTHGHVITLGEWLESGTYTVRQCTSKEIRLNASSEDLASVVLCEVENLFAHCFEHLQEAACYVADIRHRSDAWAAVTVYYLGFFASSALLRLIGRPMVFVTVEHINRFKKIALATKSPGAGAFSVELGPQTSSVFREVIFGKESKIHESTWKNTVGILDDLLHNVSINKHADEIEFYGSLCSKQFSPKGTGHDWPSWLRNKINYRPGNSYRLRQNEHAVKACVAPWLKADESRVFDLVRGIFRKSSRDPTDPSNQVAMMACLAMSIFAIARTLYKELLARRKIDSRWEGGRVRYSHMIRGNSEGPWLF